MDYNDPRIDIACRIYNPAWWDDPFITEEQRAPARYLMRKVIEAISPAAENRMEIPMPNDKGLISWKPGDAYCGKASEAINHALDKMDMSYSEQINFLRHWREGDLSEYPDFKFRPLR